MSTPNAKSGGSGFKKTVFTPCRRIGLSRKIKTPSVGTPTSETPQIPDDHNSVGMETPQKCIETPKRGVGTPKVTKTPETTVIRKALENRKRFSETQQKNVEPPECMETPPKCIQSPKLSIGTPKVTKISEAPVIRKAFENRKRSNESETSQKNVQLPERKSETKQITDVPGHKSLEVPVGEITNGLQCKSTPINKENQKLKSKKKLHTKKENSIKECSVRLDIENMPFVPVSDSKQNIQSPKKKIRKPVKRLSMKKSSSISSEDLSDEDFNTTKSSASNSQVEVFKSMSKRNKEIVSKPKRRRAVLSSSEDEDFVTSQGSSKAKEEKDLRIKVQELSEKIQQKTLRLQDLQQASVYRNLHKVKDLGELTQKWKKGCEDAVRTLHKKLQDHGPISMLALLEKLNVPSEFLCYNTDNDEFS